MSKNSKFYSGKSSKELMDMFRQIAYDMGHKKATILIAAKEIADLEDDVLACDAAYQSTVKREDEAQRAKERDEARKQREAAAKATPSEGEAVGLPGNTPGANDGTAVPNSGS